MQRTIRTSTVAALAALPGAAWAHHFMDGSLPQTFAQGLLSGLGHPLIGLDHAAFIVAAGFLLALVRGGMWGVATLVAGSLAGAALHLAGADLPWGEVGVALSVLLAGGLVIARRRVALPWLAGGMLLAGALHGHAYAEAIFGAETAPLAAYLTGFSFIQFCVATAAFLAHRWLAAARADWVKPVSSGLGAAAGAVGLVFLALNLAG